MQIESLKVFCDVARLRSFSRGAQSNGILQSSASQAIHHLEEHLGVQLIDRSRRPWRLTEQGRRFYEGCRPVVDRYFQLEAAIKNSSNHQSGPIRVAAIYSVGLGTMSQLIERFCQSHPGTDVEIEYLHPREVRLKVEQEQADLGIVSFPRAGRGLDVIPLRSEPMVAVCHPSHRLASARKLPLSSLQGEPFVGFNRDLVIRREIDRFLRQHRVAVDVTLEFDNVEAIKRAVEIGSGISILPLPTLDRELAARSLVAIPFSKASLDRPLGIIHRRGRQFDAVTAAFISELQHDNARNGHHERN